MRFFTPELYLRFNSRDDAVALAADAEWEAAIARYDGHLESFRSKMPSQVVKLSEMCLHDADILLRQEQQEPFELPYAKTGPAPWPLVPWYGVFTLAVRHEDQVLAILYFLWDHVAEKPVYAGLAVRRRPASIGFMTRSITLPGAGGHFVHNVLMSTGIVLSIPFSAVLILAVPSGTGGWRGAIKADRLSRLLARLTKAGGVAEWPIAPVLKTGDGASRPRVRIPPPPLSATAAVPITGSHLWVFIRG